MKKTIPAYPYVTWAITFIIVPLIMILAYSAIDTSGGSIRFTSEHIMKCFQPLYLGVILYSFKIAIYCTIICLLAGYPIAMILAGDTFKHKNLLLFLIIVPMWMNFLLRTYAWLTILETNGILNRLLGMFNVAPKQLLYNEGAVMLGMVYNFLPFMILPIYSVLTKMDKSIIEAAHDLGAGKKDVFLRVILPLSMPGVFSGIVMVFMPAVTTFVVTRLLGGGKHNMIGNIIEHQFVVAGDWGFGSALSALLMLIILISIAISSKLDLQEEVEGGGLL
ncbi:MAG: ABC transporter permease [Eubacteriales bacterium]|jgi:spermidine/putrescine transport system permease protein|nr:ABC transporter permease [Eubacteriales bacterium]